MLALNVTAQQVKRVEPMNWWVGMKNPIVQIMFHGVDLKGATLTVNSKDISIEKITYGDRSDNYLFADVKVAPKAKPAEYEFTITKNGKSVKVPYAFLARANGSAQRESYTSADAVYLLMPDRFAKGKLAQPSQEIDLKIDRSEPYARHGGNLQGVIDNLDYIAGLGMTAIWSTPLWDDRETGGSYHGYAAADFYKIHPLMGSNELYKEYVEKAHAKGLKVIMDLVPNHCGIDHWWMADLPFGDWVNYGGEYKQTRYAQSAQLDPNASKSDFENNCDGWFVSNMPDMNLRNPYMLSYLAQNAIWWAEFSGLDGFRVDTYPYNDKWKAAEWTQRILNEYPKMNIVGECWVNTPAFVSYWDGAAQNRDGYSSRLPSVMDFPLQTAINNAIQLDSVKGWNQGAMELYFILAHDYLYANANTLLIFGENHDTDRLAHFTKGNAAKQMLVYSMLATMRGTPQLYYGSEVLLRGDQTKGHGGQRVDFPGGWSEDSRNLFKDNGLTSSEDSVLQHVRKLFNWRKDVKAVHNGKMTQFFPDVPENLYVYGRHTDDELVFVVLNMNAASREVKWEKYAELFDGYSVGLDIVSGKEVKIGENLVLPARSSLVVHCKK